jgi:hypothetical protein
MSKLKNMQEVNKKFEKRFLIYEQSSSKMSPCRVGQSGTLVGTMVNGKKVYVLSKTGAYKDAFCYVPDSNTITTTDNPQA